ncbi:CPBP family glutamic-type intramembrane protease [Bacillus toyonensis]|uniref:CPBP family intramembrane metalloprotease n=2 Tax=Bacillus thuringiensis TaxID=1428 RepID=A0A242VZG2_BACTU|nr:MULTISPECIES: CPBP family glutamic-type intramembrane protease [Bacillus cereus group]MEB9670229.1 CPBP family glutamic-type intramembrane protease [Bacillus anthracis]MED3540670.1 CPBP family glutamic-type intramembrane protease [Bacillus toyonensis]MEE2022169.1 CPBP family glutamic-type intramembrane protease [Bacillus toyonensis]OTW44557.1 CPBP family intramembrane metalloprotease [Bacillus thuringiensis serovar mexicanensis]OTW98712.1 CPBP family intramembrane metalloprotease [Bacillus 
MNTAKRKHPKLHLIIFVLIVLASGWIGVFLDSLLMDQPEGNSLGMGLWLILPFLASILLRVISRDWNDFGIRINLKGNFKWYFVSLLIYPFVTIITVSLAFIFGVANISSFEMSSLFSLIFMSTIGNFIKNIFEEFSWRGYLTPKLIELQLNDWLVYIVSGLIWALWHAAYYLVFLPNEYFESISRLNMLLSGCILMVCWSIMYVEIYRLTKSVWPCVFMHAIEDAVPTVLVTITGIITLTNSSDFWLNPISGVVATVLFLGIGILLRTIRIKKGRDLPAENNRLFTI